MTNQKTKAKVSEASKYNDRFMLMLVCSMVAGILASINPTIRTFLIVGMLTIIALKQK